MAYIDAAAILARLRAVLEDGTGALRAIADTTFDGGLYEGLGQGEKSRRALDIARVEAAISRVTRNEASPPRYGSLALYDIEVTVRVVRHVPPSTKVNDALRDAVKAAAAQDADIIAQGLCTLGNLDASTTGIVSGRLMFEGSDVPEGAFDEDESDGVVETIHLFSGIVEVAQAVT